MNLGSIELARTICEELKGELPDGEQYGSVDIAEILSAHVRNLEDHIVAIKAQRAEGAPQWISVKDRLPKKTHRVLVAYRKAFNSFRPTRHRRQVYEARYSGGAWRFLSPNLKNRLSDHVTHWMPLPAAPSSGMNSPQGERSVKKKQKPIYASSHARALFDEATNMQRNADSYMARYWKLSEAAWDLIRKDNPSVTKQDTWLCHPDTGLVERRDAADDKGRQK